MTKRLVALILSVASLAARAQTTPVKVDSLVRAYVAVQQFNGSAIVVQGKKKVYEKSYGYANAATKALNTSRSIFPIGSLTKPFTALLILKLAEEHKLSTDDRLSTYLPSYPNGDQIRIHQLLTNTAGVYEKFRNRAFVNQLTAAHPFTTEERLAFFQNEPLDFEPGTRFSYSNSGYDLLGAVIEKVTGACYADVVRRYIFQPLHMKASGFGFADLRAANKTTLYSYASATKQVETTPWNASLTFSSGGLYSSPADLLKFYQGLRAYKIVSKETFAKATTPFLGGYGYGWYIDVLQGDRVIDHGGNIEGATSYFLLMPDHQVGIILLNNITSTALEKLGNAIYAALQNKPYTLPQPKKAIRLDEPTLLSYTGTFEVSATYKVQVFKEAAGLFVQINNEPKIPVLPEKEGVFFAADDDMVLEFIAKDKKIMQVKIKKGLTTKVADKVG